MITGEALCQLGLYLWLPYLSLLRALMGYSWFCDQTTRQTQPIALIAYSCLCFGVLVLHATCYHPEPAQSGEVDPLMTVDWDEVTARNARFRARENCRYHTQHYACCILPQIVQPVPTVCAACCNKVMVKSGVMSALLLIP